MGKKSLTVLALLLMSLLYLSADTYRVVPNYGHQDRAISLDWDRERDTLLSLGKDSCLLATDLEELRVLNRIPLTGDPLKSRVNPVFPEIALITETTDSYLLTVLNWQTGKTLLERTMKEIPFFMEYSRSGEIFLLGNGEIQFLDHETGEAVEGPEGITELLSYGYLGGTEKTFMGYSPSGTLIYYDRFSSQIKGQADTVEDLTDLAILAGDVRLLTARKDNSVLLIDRQTGGILDTLEEEEIISYHCQSDEGIITVLSKDKNEFTLAAYKIKRDRFSRETEKNLDLSRGLTASLYENGTFIMGCESGELLSSGRRSRSVLDLLPGRPLTIDSLAMIDDRLLIGSGKELTIWESPFFEEEGLSTNYLLNLKNRELTLPLENSRIAASDRGGVFWQPDNRVKFPYYLLNNEGELIPLFEPEVKEEEEKSPYTFQKEITFGFKELNYYKDLEVLLDEDKTCRVFRLSVKDDLFAREELYTYSHPSLETAAMVSDGRLALGTNTYFGGHNSMSITDIFTGESIPLTDDRSVVTDFLSDDSEEGFYSFGFLERENVTYGQVRFHDFSQLFDEAEIILEFPQATTDGCRMIRGRDDTIYVTTPDGRWYSSGVAQPERDSRSLDSIVSHDGYLYRIEKDHSLVICREDTLEVLSRVYFFGEGEWVAVKENSRYHFHSSGARKFFTVYKIKD